MAKFLGVSIAGLVHKNLSKKLNDVQLIKVAATSRTIGSSTSGMGKTTTILRAKGFVDVYDDNLIDGTIISKKDRKINIIALSIPNFQVPKVGDRITAEGDTYNVLDVSRDPAGAMYTCQGRAGG